MRAEPLGVEDARLLRLDPVEDARGLFARLYCDAEFAALGLNPAVAQINLSVNPHAGTLRGLHFQRPPHAEAKVIRVVRGALWDVLVDLRPESPSFGRWTTATLSAANRLAVYAPCGVAHGFLTLEPDTEVLYLMSTSYAPEHGAGLRWDDPDVAIRWPDAPQVISDKDAGLPGLREAAALASGARG